MAMLYKCPGRRLGAFENLVDLVHAISFNSSFLGDGRDAVLGEVAKQTDGHLEKDWRLVRQETLDWAKKACEGSMAQARRYLSKPERQFLGTRVADPEHLKSLVICKEASSCGPSNGTAVGPGILVTISYREHWFVYALKLS